MDAEKVDFHGCAICLEPYSEGVYTKFLPCFHEYHSKCVNQWLLHRNACATCMMPVFISIPTVYIQAQGQAQGEQGRPL